MPPTTPTTLSTEAMKGRHVTGREGEDLGKIQEVMIDLSAGRVAYAVMSFGGFLGIGARSVAIPWGALHASNRPDEYRADLSKDLLRDAPTFGKDRWPGGADRTFLSSLYAYYGYEPYWDVTEQEEEPSEEPRHTQATPIQVPPGQITPIQPAIVETTIVETTTTEYGDLGEVGGIGREDLSAGAGSSEMYGEPRHTATSDLGGALSDTDMTDERWRYPRDAEPPRPETTDNPEGRRAEQFEDLEQGSEIAFGSTSGGSDRYADTSGSNERMEPNDFPALDAVSEGQGNTRAFEGDEEEGTVARFDSPSGLADVSGASGLSSASATGGSEGISASEDLSIGSVDDLNTIGSTLGLENDVFQEDEYSELPGEGSRRGSSASGDFRKNEGDISEDDTGSIRSGRGHSSGQPSSTQESSSCENEDEDKDKNEG